MVSSQCSGLQNHGRGLERLADRGRARHSEAKSLLAFPAPISVGQARLTNPASRSTVPCRIRQYALLEVRLIHLHSPIRLPVHCDNRNHSSLRSRPLHPVPVACSVRWRLPPDPARCASCQAGSMLHFIFSISRTGRRSGHGTEIRAWAFVSPARSSVVETQSSILQPYVGCTTVAATRSTRKGSIACDTG